MQKRQPYRQADMQFRQKRRGNPCAVGSGRLADLRRFLLAQLTALDALRYAAPAPHAASPLRQAQSLVKQLRQRIGAYRRARPAPSSAR